jgi:hypothetical protein
MKRDTQKLFHDHARQAQRTRKVLQLSKETLRELSGGSRGPVLDSPTTIRSQCPTLCF